MSPHWSTLSLHSCWLCLFCSCIQISSGTSGLMSLTHRVKFVSQKAAGHIFRRRLLPSPPTAPSLLCWRRKTSTTSCRSILQERCEASPPSPSHQPLGPNTEEASVWPWRDSNTRCTILNTRSHLLFIMWILHSVWKFITSHSHWQQQQLNILWLKHKLLLLICYFVKFYTVRTPHSQNSQTDWASFSSFNCCCVMQWNAAQHNIKQC